MKLSFFLAACFLEEVWKMKLETLSEGDRKDYLRSFGVDPQFFGIKQYNRSQLQAAKEAFERVFAELAQHLKELKEDLGVSVDAHHREPGASTESNT